MLKVFEVVEELSRGVEGVLGVSWMFLSWRILPFSSVREVLENFAGL